MRYPGSEKRSNPQGGLPNILVYRPGQLGDTICAIPAICAVRENFEPCNLVLLSNAHVSHNYPKASDILLEFGMIEEAITYPDASFRLNKILALRHAIHQRGINTVFYFAPFGRRFRQKMRDMLFFKWCGIKNIYGLRFKGGDATNSPIAHETDRLLQILKRDGFKTPTAARFKLSVSAMARARVDRLWQELCLQNKTVIAIGTGSKMPVKRWEEEKYRELGLRVAACKDMRVLLLGGSEDHPGGARLCEAWNGTGYNLSGKTSYMESAEVLTRCRLYVGNDNGAMHLAAAVGTPCVAIFSSRDVPGRWYPYGEGHTIVRRDVECQGCMLEECVNEKMKCIKSVTVDEVFSACAKYLG
jgi:ADP-heptose:LPS heptosyltransferase